MNNMEVLESNWAETYPAFNITPQLIRPPRILVVEDDVTMRPLMDYIVQTLDPRSEIIWVDSEESADERIRLRGMTDQQFNIIIADVFLNSRRTGIDLWKRHNNLGPSFLLISGAPPSKFRRLLGKVDRGPVYLQKPLNPDECVEVLRLMLEYPGYY